ncbi:hypothetical protein MCEMSEM23_00501 [Rhabdaerophilaceae bacterium]
MRVAVYAAPLVVAALFMSPAQAITPSCQADFQKFIGQREAAIKRINGFNKKRPTATQACSAFSSLSGSEGRLIKWMTDNLDWCQVPSQMLEQLKQANGQTQKVRAQACTVARREAQGQAAGGAPRGAPPPGAGVRLPQGAL